ncbi:MAG: hypothetical protein HY820_31495 [Acidobacteria bacterium]|nr:hypothetical protein [Acidobacteriota bacterium]
MKSLMTQMIIAIVLLAAHLGATEVFYGMVGLAAADTARLSAFCSEEASAPTIPPDSCEGEFHFHDVRGQIVKRAALSLQPGFTGFLDLRPAEGGASVGGRVGIIPCVFVGRGRVFGSVRIFDMFTQRQRVLAIWADRSLARGGELHFGVSGITAFDTARINAVCAEETRTLGGSCEVTFIFHLSGGKIVKQSTMTLAPGAGAFLDLRSSEMGLGARPGEIIPCLRIGRGGVFATYEMIDTASTFTTLLAYPATAILP